MIKKLIFNQFLPISLSVVTFTILCILLYYFLLLLNLFPHKANLRLTIRPQDVLVGVTVYVKCAIDFALFMGSLMSANNGPRKRIAIELGTAFGNGVGTLLVLTIWFFFKEVPLLLGLMIFISGIVLLAMAEEGFEKIASLEEERGSTVKHLSQLFATFLTKTNHIFKPLIRIIIPEEGIINAKTLPFWRLVGFAFVVPFILGLDDFAGYIPLFDLVNVLGFASGAFLAHLLLTAFLFVSPTRTVQIARNPFILLFGSLAFIGIAFYGFFEVMQLVLTLL